MKHLSILPTLAVLALLTGVTGLVVLPAQATDHWISMTADGFDPAYLEVTVGDNVYWVNEDYDLFEDHSTHSYTYWWNSGAVPVGYYTGFTTGKTGTYDYIDDVGWSGTGTLVIKPAGPPPPTFISAPGRMDMVYDPGRDVLYITSGSTVLQYQLGSSSFLTPYQLSGSLMGIDISPDGNTLMVADSSASPTNVWVYTIDLTTGQTNRVTFPMLSYERGTFAVAFGGDGAALVTSRYSGSGSVPLRRYDPASRQTSVIGPGWVRTDCMVSSSGDLSTILIAQTDASTGPFNRYDVASKAIIRNGGDNWYNFECAASRDASLFALPTYGGTFVYDGNFNFVTNIGGPIGAAFHPAADAVFFPINNTTYVQAFSTATWQMLAQYDFANTFMWPGNHAFDNGRIRISPDGQIIFVTVSGGVKYLRHGLDVPLTHRLVVAGNPKPYGASTPTDYGTYWLPDGSWVTAGVPAFVETNGTVYVCTGWTGTGSAAGSGTETSDGFSLMANTTLTWNWAPLTLSASMDFQPGGNQITLQWPSVAGKSYDVLYSTDLHTGFTAVATDLYDTAPNNTYQCAAGPGRVGFYRIRVK
jgi:plastocyanin